MFPKSFVAWMDEHKELREMIANGKDKLEWSRQVIASSIGIVDPFYTLLMMMISGVVQPVHC